MRDDGATARDDVVSAGVVGVGEMGRHHARVYAGLRGVDLVGVADVDRERAAEVAGQYDTRPMDRSSLFEAADVVSVAVPTEYHYEVAREAIESGVSVLVEKPFVRDPSDGWDLVERARDAGVTLTVGHIERYNPAVGALEDVVPDLDLVGIQARRLGPPLDDDRAVADGVGLDLMVHDIDVVRTVVGLAGGDPDAVEVVDAAAAAEGEYAAALLSFDGVVGTFTASRTTQRKVRDLFITAGDCCVTLDYTARSVRIHRRSLPSYVADDGGLQYRHESVTERPTVANGEPLVRELEAFVGAVREGRPPAVTGADGVRAVELAREVQRVARDRPTGVTR